MKSKSLRNICLRLGVLGLLILAAGFFPKEVKAAEYTYTVTVYAGDKGTFANVDFVQVDDRDAVKTPIGNTAVQVSNISAGSRITIRAQAGTTVNAGENYVIQGVRRSGRDNDVDDVNATQEEIAERSGDYQDGSFAVNYDRDYVISYTRQGELTKYTILYETESGKQLAEPEEYYGNVGDDPVIAYLYIDGYRPQAFNLKKTLVADSSKNIFRFIYRKAPVREQNETITEYEGTVTIGGSSTGTGAGGAGNAGGATAVVPSGNNSNSSEVTGGGPSGEVIGAPELEEPKELINLDDEEVPLGIQDLDDGESISALNRRKAIFASVLAAAAIGALALIVILGSRRKKKDDFE